MAKTVTVTYEKGTVFVDQVVCRLSPLWFMATVSVLLVALEELFNCDRVSVLDHPADFFKSLKGLVWAVLDDVVDRLRDVLI